MLKGIPDGKMREQMGYLNESIRGHSHSIDQSGLILHPESHNAPAVLVDVQ